MARGKLRWRREERSLGLVEPSYRLKLKRALEHIQALEDTVFRWTETDPCIIARECQVDTRHHLTTVRVLEQPTDLLIPLLIGDAVHAMRQGLDHLA
jgi:hypothetical protein